MKAATVKIEAMPGFLAGDPWTADVAVTAPAKGGRMAMAKLLDYCHGIHPGPWHWCRSLGLHGYTASFVDPVSLSPMHFEQFEASKASKIAGRGY